MSTILNPLDTLNSTWLDVKPTDLIEPTQSDLFFNKLISNKEVKRFCFCLFLLTFFLPYLISEHHFLSAKCYTLTCMGEYNISLIRIILMMYFFPVHLHSHIHLNTHCSLLFSVLTIHYKMC